MQNNNVSNEFLVSFLTHIKELSVVDSDLTDTLGVDETVFTYITDVFIDDFISLLNIDEDNEVAFDTLMSWFNQDDTTAENILQTLQTFAKKE
jgi:hypothetical protein